MDFKRSKLTVEISVEELGVISAALDLYAQKPFSEPSSRAKMVQRRWDKLYRDFHALGYGVRKIEIVETKL